jgi:acyl carrier protein phosphodiesterase
MNYFGHAAVAARWRGNLPSFVLGAMLPDLVKLGSGVPHRSPDPLIQEGVAFHIRTDTLFHDHPLFQQWHVASLARMRESDVGKGPARAAAHIGIEMLLDDALAESRDARTSYIDALRYGTELTPELELERSSPSTAAELREVCRTLLTFSGRIASADEERLRLRMERTLSRRPRIAASQQELSTIVKILTEYRVEVSSAAPRLVDDLLHGLGSRSQELSEPLCTFG